MKRRLGIDQIHDLKTFDLAKISKRLQVIKQLIELEDIEDIPPHLRKLENFHLPTEVEEIIKNLRNGKYGDSVALISNYINKHSQLTAYIDPEIDALKLEIKLIELAIASVDSQKREVEKRIQDFGMQHNRTLGDLIRRILEVRQEISKIEVERNPEEKQQEKYEEYKKDYEDYQKDYQALREKTYQTLNETDTLELKKAYRKASMLCHPDANTDKSPEVQAQLEEIFKDLNQANSENDLSKVRDILERLKSGDLSRLKVKSEQAEDKKQLRSKIDLLKKRLSEMEATLANILASSTYQKLENIEDWEAYFEKSKGQFEEQLEDLQSKLDLLYGEGE
ncbi:MAG: chromosome segregation ATPase [Saprospiraceae bacterium]